MLFLFVLAVATALAQQADLECEVDLFGGTTLLDDPNSRLNVTTDTLPLGVKFGNETLQLRYQINLQAGGITLTAFDANGTRVGSVKTYTQLLEANCILAQVGESPDCSGIIGCDGFVMRTVQTLRQFPNTARLFLVNFTFLVIDPTLPAQLPLTIMGWKKSAEITGARIVLTSGPELLLWVPSDALRAQAEAAAGPLASDTDWKLIASILIGALGMAFLCLLVVGCFVARRGQVVFLSEHELRPLVQKRK